MVNKISNDILLTLTTFEIKYFYFKINLHTWELHILQNSPVFKIGFVDISRLLLKKGVCNHVFMNKLLFFKYNVVQNIYVNLNILDSIFSLIQPLFICLFVFQKKLQTGKKDR